MESSLWQHVSVDLAGPFNGSQCGCFELYLSLSVTQIFVSSSRLLSAASCFVHVGKKRILTICVACCHEVTVHVFEHVCDSENLLVE